MATNIQTLGDEAIYVPWPGYTGTPTPASGKTISGLTGKKELRYIKDQSGTVIWAHKWRLTCSGSNCTFEMTSNDPKFSRSGNVGRCKNAKTITVTVVPNAGYSFTKWADGSTANPRVFTMTDHVSYEATVMQAYQVTIRALSDTNANAGIIYSGYFEKNSVLDLTQIPVDSTSVAVIRSIQNFHASFDNEANPTKINLKTSGFTGWTLDRLRGTIGGVEKDVSVDEPIVVSGDMVVACSWTRQITNKFIETSSSVNTNALDGNFFLYQVDTTANVALPAFGRLYISEMYGLLTHEGNATSHPMCIFATVNSITDTVSGKSEMSKGSSYNHNETSWHDSQELKFSAYRWIRDSTSGSQKTIAGSSDNGSDILRSSSTSSYNDGTSWDILVNSMVRPYAPRVTPMKYSDWHKYIAATKRADAYEPDINTSTELNQFINTNIANGVYQNWSTLRTLFTHASTVFGTGEDEEGNPINYYLKDVIAMINGGTYTEITNDNTVLTDNMVVYLSDNVHTKSAVYIFDCCSEDFTTQVPAASVGDSIYEYLYEHGYTFPGYNVRVMTNNPDDMDELIDITPTEENGTVFENLKNYFLRSIEIDPSTGEETETTYYIEVRNGTVNDYIYPICSGETVNEYKARIARYKGVSVAELNITLYTQDIANNSNAIYVTKSTGNQTTAEVVFGEQTDSWLSIPQKLANKQTPCGLNLVMMKSVKGCTVKWKFFLYSLKINMF